MNIVNLHIGKLNLYYVAYLYNGRERERERERESTLQDHVMYIYKSIIILCPKQSCYIIIMLHYYMENCIYPTSPMFIMGNLFPS